MLAKKVSTFRCSSVLANSNTVGTPSPGTGSGSKLNSTRIWPDSTHGRRAPGSAADGVGERLDLAARRRQRHVAGRLVAGDDLELHAEQVLQHVGPDGDALREAGGADDQFVLEQVGRLF